LTAKEVVVLNPDRGDDCVRDERGLACALDPVDERNARNQLVFREVNERIAELSGEWGQTDVSLFICECSDQACAETVEITPAEYERVRGDGARFVVRAGHQLPELEHVVEGNGRFLVVEKVGPAVTIARASDPRQHV
jgi:hypothetical protein